LTCDDLIGLSSVLRPRQHSIGYGRQFLQVKRPNQQYQGTYSTQRNDDLIIELIGISSTTVKSCQNATF